MASTFLIWSDLHNEHWEGFSLPEVDKIDGVLIAGDTDVRGKHLDIPIQAAKKYKVPVVVVWGNHELYGSSKEMVQGMEDGVLEGLEDDVDIRVLQGEATTIGNVRIIGATLWTDFQVHPELYPFAMMTIPSWITDYKEIASQGRLLTVRDVISWHTKDKERIFKELEKPHDGKTIVMTHHLPIKQLIHPKHAIKNKFINAAFASDLLDQLKQFNFDYWICGHSHENVNYRTTGQFGEMKFIMNQRGYPHDNCQFNPKYTLTV